MSIELRSKSSIDAAKRVLESGDYNNETELQLKFHTPFFNATWQTRQSEVILEQMMDNAGKLPNLKALTIVPIVNVQDGARKCRVPAKALQKIVDRARKLKNLTVHNIMLVGNRQEFEALAESFKKHPVLNSVALKCGCQERQEQEWNNETLTYDSIPNVEISPLDPVICALGSVKSVEKIELASGIRSGDLTTGTLEQLGRRSTLKVLKVLTFKLSDDLLSILAQGLKSSTLATFKLSCQCLGEKGSKALQELMRNNSGVRFCHFTFFDFEAKSDVNILLRGVIKAIGRSDTHRLTLDVSQKYIKILKENTREMLRGNYTLTDVSTRKIMYNSHYDVEDDELQFLVKTNKLGRGRLFQGPQDDQETADKISWLTLFEATNNDLSNIFYLVRSHPFEFADMGLKDCSENMAPTMRTMKSLLANNNRKLSKVTEDTENTIMGVKKSIHQSMKARLNTTTEKICERLSGIELEQKKNGDSIDSLLREMKQEQDEPRSEMSSFHHEHGGDSRKLDSICSLLREMKKEQKEECAALVKELRVEMRIFKQEQQGEKTRLMSALFWYKGASMFLFVVLMTILAGFKLDSL